MLRTQLTRNHARPQRIRRSRLRLCSPSPVAITMEGRKAISSIYRNTSSVAFLHANDSNTCLLNASTSSPQLDACCSEGANLLQYLSEKNGGDRNEGDDPCICTGQSIFNGFSSGFHIKKSSEKTPTMNLTGTDGLQHRNTHRNRATIVRLQSSLDLHLTF